MTFVVIAGILVASDGWSAHLASCIQEPVLASPIDQARVVGLADCCDVLTDRGLGLVGPEVCWEPDDCACCSHSSSDHLGELDNRALSELDRIDLSGFLAPLQWTGQVLAPPAPHWVNFTTVHSLLAAPIFLLLGHLRF